MNAYQVVHDFEAAIAEFCESRFAVSVDSCTNALFLCMMLKKIDGIVVDVPRRTYPSVPMCVARSGGKIRWTDENWTGAYELKPLGIVDSAKRFRRGMYREFIGSLCCLSHHIKKLLPIGRGGMILTDSEEAAKYLRMMRFDGREECPLHIQRNWPLIGYNCYMTPEQSARGLQLLSLYKDQPDQIEEPPYPDCSVMECFKPYTAERLKSES